jgi:hypothetical protein
MYYVSHLGGFVSTFNIDALKDVKLYKAGFPAGYGDRLSSVVDIRMKEGDMQHFKGNAMLGVIASKISVEGPVLEDTASYIFSARRMLLDVLTYPFSIGSDTRSSYHFYDVNAKINYRLNDNNHLFISAYMGDDRSVFVNKSHDYESGEKTVCHSKMGWGNRLAAFRWNHVFSPVLFGNLTLSFTRFRFLKSSQQNSQGDENYSYFNYLSGIYDTQAKYDMEYSAGTHYSLKFGFSATHHIFKPGLVTTNESVTDQISAQTVDANGYSAYVENLLNVGKFNANIGIRYGLYDVKSVAYARWEPRIMLNYRFIKNSAIKISSQ